jgi:uncharacterized membrane protein YphA (DoxX/SURF4 family)
MKIRSDRLISRDWALIQGKRLRNTELFYSLAYHLLRIGLGCLFVYAGFTKLLDPKAFAHSIAQFDLLPEMVLPLVAVGLPALEVLAGVGLIFEVRGSLSAISGLLTVFLLVLGYAVWLDLDIDCGCFTVAELSAKTGVKQAFFRDLALAALMVFLFWRRRVLSPASTTLKANQISVKGEKDNV